MDDNHLPLLINIDKKVDEVKDKLHGIEVIQSRMEGDLKYHIKRTDLLEEQVELVNKKTESFAAFGLVMNNVIKVFPFLSGAIVAIVTLYKIFKK
jgi:hypothetical protein